MSRNIRSVHAYVCSVQGYAHVERRVVPKSLFENPFSPHDQGRIGRVCKLMVHWHQLFLTGHTSGLCPGPQDIFGQKKSVERDGLSQRGTVGRVDQHLCGRRNGDIVRRLCKGRGGRAVGQGDALWQRRR